MTGPSKLNGLEPIDKALIAGIVYFSLLVVLISKWSPNDGQTFQLIGGLATGFAAAFLARIKPSDKNPPPNDSQGGPGAHG